MDGWMDGWMMDDLVPPPPAGLGVRRSKKSEDERLCCRPLAGRGVGVRVARTGCRATGGRAPASIFFLKRRAATGHRVRRGEAMGFIRDER